MSKVTEKEIELESQRRYAILEKHNIFEACMKREAFKHGAEWYASIPLVNERKDNVGVWVSVEDSLPEIFDYVLVNLLGTVLKGRRYSNGWTCFFADGEHTVLDNTPHRRVTHWMPLPEPPESQPQQKEV